jgi:hypothetical protein
MITSLHLLKWTIHRANPFIYNKQWQNNADVKEDILETIDDACFCFLQYISSCFGSFSIAGGTQYAYIVIKKLKTIREAVKGDNNNVSPLTHTSDCKGSQY